jgi:hypothetical protein
MQPSIFAPFGHYRFSVKEPIAATIYGQMRDGLGGDAVLGEETFEGDLHAGLFAKAMCCAGAQRCIDRVNLEANPATASELLDEHMGDYRASVAVTATDDEKRAELASALVAAQGNTATVADAALSTLLGSRLLNVRHFGDGEAVTFPAAWETSGLWKSPSTVAKTHQLANTVWPGVWGFAVTPVDGDGLVGGDEAIVEPGRLGVEERVTVQYSPSTGMYATFVRPHPAGSIITTKPWPRAANSGRWLLVVVDSATAVSALWRKRVAKVLKKLLRSTDRWSLVDEIAANQIGPFEPGDGIPGVTPLVQTTTANP